MRRSCEHGHCCNNRKQCEDNKTESVKDHGGELPVILNGRALLIVPDLVRDDLYLFQD